MKPLAVRASRIHGRGVFAALALPQRRKLGEIEGELVRLPQARHAAERRAKIYLIELNRRWALDCSRKRPFKFLNHSCQPNCYLRIYRKRVEVYTLRRIAAGTELTVEYGLTPHKDGMVCHCESARCKERL